MRYQSQLTMTSAKRRCLNVGLILSVFLLAFAHKRCG